MPITPETSTSVDPAPASPSASGARAVFVAGSGRSGTSTFAGALQQLGVHVPQPEVVADKTNPRGFGEPQWVVDFHNRLLKRTRVHVSDARPQAWFETGKVGMAEGVRQELTDWLSLQAREADELVIKDPRLSWFLGLWRVAAIRSGVTPCFVTMLRPPMEVVGSKEKAYGNRGGDISGMAAWVNMMLHTEQATRGSARAFLRYHDLLEDWTTSVFRAGQVLGLERVQNARGADIRRVHEFIDPGLRSVQATWEDFTGPHALRAVAQATWENLDRLAEPDGDTAEVHAELDRLREDYTRLYADAESIAKSTTVAAARRAAFRATKALERAQSADKAAQEVAPSEQATQRVPTAVERAAAKVPHGVRAMVPARMRARARKALSAGREARS